MSRAFINEDASGPEPRYNLPDKSDPSYDAAAAHALIDGANQGDSYSAELATGYKWGEQKLRTHVERILADARTAGDERTVQLAERYLKVASG